MKLSGTAMQAFNYTNMGDILRPVMRCMIETSRDHPVITRWLRDYTVCNWNCILWSAFQWDTRTELKKSALIVEDKTSPIFHFLFFYHQFEFTLLSQHNGKESIELVAYLRNCRWEKLLDLQSVGRWSPFVWHSCYHVSRKPLSLHFLFNLSPLLLRYRHADPITCFTHLRHYRKSNNMVLEFRSPTSIDVSLVKRDCGENGGNWVLKCNNLKRLIAGLELFFETEVGIVEEVLKSVEVEKIAKEEDVRWYYGQINCFWLLHPDSRVFFCNRGRKHTFISWWRVFLALL